ncbi:hypothetical protein ACTFIY_005141 [Dictyostelium cf. discoideum]
MEYSNKWIIPDYRKFSALYAHKKIFPNGDAGKQGKFAVYLEKKPKSGILLKYTFSFSLIPPDDSTATKVSWRPKQIDFEKSQESLGWVINIFTDSKKVLKDFLNEKGELELSFSTTIQDEKIIPL